jgi:hypothetical protein
LADEARNTERPRNWNSDLKLRYSRVNFVSAGTLNPGENKALYSEELGLVHEPSDSYDENAISEQQQFLAALSLHSRSTIIKQQDIPVCEAILKKTARVAPLQSSSGVVEAGIVYFDTSAVTTTFGLSSRNFVDRIETGPPPPAARRSPSLTPSSSSEDVVVFGGRTSHGRILVKEPDCAYCASSNSVHALGRIPDIMEHISTASNTNGKYIAPTTAVKGGVPVDDNIGGMMYEHRTSGTRRSKRREAKVRKQDNIFADYISNVQDSNNMSDFGEAGVLKPLSVAFGHRDLGNVERDVVLPPLNTARQRKVEADKQWSIDDFLEIDDLSTSSSIIDIAKEVVSEREGLSSLQYLVVSEDSTTDKTKWVHAATLDALGTDDAIARSKGEGAFILGPVPTDLDDIDSSCNLKRLLDGNLEHGVESTSDERDLSARAIAKMTDQQIARRLAKQESLGLGSKELLLFTADEAVDFRESDGSGSSLQLQTNDLPNGALLKKTLDEALFVSTTTSANALYQDPYNDFDIMDHNRPSLRRVLKGRRGNTQFQLSDSTIDFSMQAAWENDRAKKKTRKQEREKLRSLRLLGVSGNIDMKAKYPEGMSISQVKDELRSFLLSGKDVYVVLSTPT